MTSTAVLVHGAGALGARTVRELLATRPAPSVRVVTARRGRATELRSQFGASAEVAVHSGPGPATAAAGTVVVLAVDSQAQAELARAYLSMGCHVVSTAEGAEDVRELRALHGHASERGSSLVLGAAFSPGLTCLLVAHGAGSLDQLDEVHVARVGWGGGSCRSSWRRALRGTPREWRDGTWDDPAPGSGRELCWFPDPLGGRDCFRAATAEPELLVAALPGLERATARLAMDAVQRVAVLLPEPVSGAVLQRHAGTVGAVRVELRGAREGERVTVVRGVLERPVVGAAAVAAVTALAVGAGDAPVGAVGLAAWPDPAAVLAELHRRGVRAAVQESDGA